MRLDLDKYSWGFDVETKGSKVTITKVRIKREGKQYILEDISQITI